ncbi:hypothetical protein [Pseudodesulfovibrio tunisiensis]|uniref:hypothetical protein n=1 Tax=Pseudodesulfovibrio tunisiensis TaxID=463192 RepID=UPI001FB46F8D|nr:hypothetical protein [Pseudodesulfovibrio tunisiensis]
MLDRLKNMVQSWKAKRRLEKELDPANFQRMARELRDLAVLASQVCPPGMDVQHRIKSITVEMERLKQLAAAPEFRKLSTGRKLLLKQGLTQSRKQLLESIESAPSPTETLQ